MKQHGFTLIEALIALVVLSIGLVGLAGLLVQGTKFNHSAYVRTQAMLLTYDMADRILANRAGIAAGSYNFPAITGQEIAPTCDPRTASCTPPAIATFDAFAWGNQLASVLPQRTGVSPAPTIGSVTAANGVYTITVNWIEIDPENSTQADGSVAKTFSMNLEP